MNESLATRFSRSIIFKVILVLPVSMTIVVTGSTFFMNDKQNDLMLEWNFNNNEAQLAQIMNTATTEMRQFGDRLSLLTKTSELQGMEPTTAASFLKSYSVSSLFISGETVTVYDREDKFVCDNAMVSSPTESPYPIEFSRITPHRPYITPWFRTSQDAPPQRIFAIGIVNRAAGDGSLVATFSLRRIWKHLVEYKVGKNGFVMAVNSLGEILYHPDLKQWLTGTHKIAELGLNIDPQNFDTKSAEYHTLADGVTYLTNFRYDSAYDFALFSFQPKSEIDNMVTSSSVGNWVILVASMFIIFFLAAWMFAKMGLPLNNLTYHIYEIVEGKEMEQIHVGNRNDEIGMLSKAFNVMISTIQRQIRELEAHRKSLEQEVSERTKELKIANKKLDLISRTDELTGLPNRRDMNETIANEIERTQRSRKPFCFIFVDIDHFKVINDTYGHACGDVILKSVSQTIRGLLRKYDVFARYGGEEFLTLLPETDLEGATAVAERFRRQIEMMTVHYADYTINITITLGVSQFDHRLGADRSIQLADKALYQGKESGRNKVVVWQPEWTTESDYEAAAIEMNEISKNGVPTVVTDFGERAAGNGLNFTDEDINKA